MNSSYRGDGGRVNWLRLTGLAVVALCFMGSARVGAQAYPARPINLLVAIAAGSPQDVVTRALSLKVSRAIGQPVLITNNGGAGGAIALAQAARAKADGYNLVCNGTPMLTMLPQSRQVPYQLDDFEPVMQFGSGQYGLAVRADSTWNSLKEFIDYAKGNPGRVSIGTLEVGTFLHTAIYIIQKQDGLDWIHVPYAGGGAGTNALLGGHITAESGAAGLFQLARAGRVRLLASYGERRSKSMPDVPTLRELGYDFKLANFIMLAAPRGTPIPIVRQLDAAFHSAMDDPDFVPLMDKYETDLAYRGSEELKMHLKEMYLAYGRIVRELNIPGAPEVSK